MVMIVEQLAERMSGRGTEVLGGNLGCRSEKPATNRLSYGTSMFSEKNRLEMLWVFSFQLHAHTNSLGISSTAEQTQNIIDNHSAGHESSLYIHDICWCTSGI
jgi:hypothetical protein